MVRNGHARSQQMTTVAGAVQVSAPRVNDRGINEHTGLGRATWRRAP